MKSKLLVLVAALSNASMVSLFAKPDVEPAAKRTEQPAETTEERKARLAFTDSDNINLMRLLAAFISKKEAEEERQKFAAALNAGRKADKLRQAVQLSDEEFTRQAQVLVNELLDFLAMLDMARTIIQESFQKSFLFDYNNYVNQKPLLLALIDAEKAQQEKMLLEALGNITEFRKLLDQLSAVNEVLLANLPVKAKLAIKDLMQAYIEAEKAAEIRAANINEKTPSI